MRCKGRETYRGARFVGQTVLNLSPGDQRVVGQVVCEADGFDIFLKAGGYDPLITPELVTLQIQSHFREKSLDLREFWVCDFKNLLTGLGPLGHDAVEEEDEFLRVVRHISTGLIR